MSNLYIGTNGIVAAIDSISGSELWHTSLSTGFFSSATYQDVTVLEDNDRVFVGCHGHLFCLNPKTGEIIWHNGLEGYGYNDVAMSISGKSVHAIGNPAQTHHT